MNHPYAEPLAALFGHLVPEMVLVLVACALFVGGLFRVERRLWNNVALAGVGLAFLILLVPSQQQLRGDATFGVPFLFDSLSTFTRVLALWAGAAFLLMCWDEPPKRVIADHHACYLLIVAGVSLVGSSNDLVALFLSLELVSIPTYVLIYLPRHDDAAQEAVLKYFLLSIFSSALLLFGFSYLYGLTGTTNIAGILQVLHGSSRDESIKAVGGLAQIAMLMMAAGLGFRVTAVPFHFYAPDVFQGVSTSSAALLSYIPKIAGFVAMLRVFGFVVPAGVDTQGMAPGMALSEQLPGLFWFLATLTMTVGNILAILQDNLKRLLAYSGVSHAGYMLVALASAPYLTADAPSSGVTAMLYYLVAYGAMVFGFFAVLLMLHRPERPVETVDDLAGLASNRPGLALLVTVLMLSFLGFPFTAGFTGKVFIFFGAVSTQTPAGYHWLYPALAALGMLNAAVGAWYYLRVISVMYLRSAVKPIEAPAEPRAMIAIGGCVAVTLIAAIPPGANWLLAAIGR